MNIRKAERLVISITVITLAFFSTPCAVPSLARRLVDQCGKPGRIESAPIIIVGVLKSDVLVYHPIPMRSNPTYPLQLRRLTVRVENFLKGALVRSNISVYYFAFAPGFDGPRPLGLWRVGGRRVLGLREDSGVLRTSCDGWDSCTQPLGSGAHLNYRPDTNKSIDYALADLRFTRGEGPVNEIAFATGLLWEPTELELAAYTIEKLLHLALVERGEVKASACYTLWIYTVDQIAASLHRSASEALNLAHCECVKKADGNGTCH